METVRKYWGHALLLLLFLFALSEMPFIHDGPVLSSASGETMTSQLERDVHDALDILRTSRNIREWKNSGFTPQDVLNNTFALKRKDARNTLCVALKKLSDADLSAFEIALSATKAQKELHCSAQLLQRIKSYWIAQTEAIDKALPHTENAAPVTTQTHVLRRDGSREINSNLLENGEFALVFEGALDPILTREVVEALDERGAKATFVTSGTAAREHPQIMTLLVGSGNSIGSEGSELQDLTLVAMNDAERSVSDGAKAVEIASGVRSSLFVFPFNASTDHLEALVSSRGLKPVRADLDSGDWKTYSATQLAASVSSTLKARTKGVILFHSNLHQTALALPAILDELAAKKRKLVKFEIK